MTFRPLRRPEPRVRRGSITDPATKSDLDSVKEDTLRITQLQTEIAEVAEHRRQTWIRLRDRNVSLRQIATASGTSPQTILNSTSGEE